MLKKIDCVMIQVEDVQAAMVYYRDVFGLHPTWWSKRDAGLVFPDSDTEIVLHNYPDMPSSVEVHYLVDDVENAVRAFADKGCHVLVKPFDIVMGKCAVIADPFGTRLCILDMTKGPRKLGSQ